MLNCPNCNNSLIDGAKFCMSCGQEINLSHTQPTQPVYESAPTQSAYQPVQQQTQPAQPMYQAHQPVQQQAQPIYQSPQQLLQQLSNKIQIEAIIWLIIAGIQILLGFSDLSDAETWGFLFDTSELYMNGFLLLVVAVLNIIASVKDLNYRKEIFTNPTGIVDKYTPVGGLVATLIYNLVFGGVIGVVGTIFGFVTRNFVMNNQQAFREMEKSHQPENQSVQS